MFYFCRFLSDPVCLPRLSSPQQNRGGTTEAKQKTNRIGKSCRSQLQRLPPFHFSRGFLKKQLYQQQQQHYLLVVEAEAILLSPLPLKSLKISCYCALELNYYTADLLHTVCSKNSKKWGKFFGERFTSNILF